MESNNTDRPFLTGDICIRTDYSIEDLSAKISKALLGGIPFGGKHEYIYDEIPAVYAEVLGLRFVLSRNPSEWYVLECSPISALPPFGDKVKDIDISDHLFRSIGDIEGVSIHLDLE
jgi:hypothetical protein